MLDVSVKVLPKPECETTLVFAMGFEQAQQQIRQWILQGHPISASNYHEHQLMIRLSSTENSVTQARQTLGGDQSDLEIWNQLRHQTHDFFAAHKNIWRISIPPATPLFAENKPQLTEWNGALRWIASDEDMFAQAKAVGGHATRYTLNTEPVDQVFQPLAKAMLSLQQKLKASFDPKNILNPGRLYPTL
jgi:glycolate oxidase FAD binding subunit